MSKYLENEVEFLNHIEDSLELTSGTLTKNINSELEEIEEWDSLAIMSFVSLLDETYQIEIDADILEKCKSPLDLYKLTKDLIK